MNLPNTSGERMTPEEKRAYARGYYTGRGGKWPAHKPPVPPDEIIDQLMNALRHLRDAVDSEVAKFDPDDPIEAVLGPRIEEADDALTAVTKWLSE